MVDQIDTAGSVTSLEEIKLKGAIPGRSCAPQQARIWHSSLLEKKMEEHGIIICSVNTYPLIYLLAPIPPQYCVLKTPLTDSLIFSYDGRILRCDEYYVIWRPYFYLTWDLVMNSGRSQLIIHLRPNTTLQTDCGLIDCRENRSACLLITNRSSHISNQKRSHIPTGNHQPNRIPSDIGIEAWSSSPSPLELSNYFEFSSHVHGERERTRRSILLATMRGLPAFPYPPSRPEDGYWAPVTSTINWCEDDYWATIYSAEIVNTLTNLLFMGLGIKGARSCIRNGHDKIFLISFVGYTLVGAGSFAFVSWYSRRKYFAPDWFVPWDISWGIWAFPRDLSFPKTFLF